MIDKVKSRVTQLVELRIVHYLIAGVSAFVVEYASFYVLYLLVKLPLIIANSASFLLGLSTSFILNKLWTFATQEYAKRTTHQLGIYIFVAGVNLLLTNLLVELFRHYNFGVMISKLAAMILTSLWNFVIFKKIIFKHSRPQL